jgi:hypothetical protein
MMIEIPGMKHPDYPDAIAARFSVSRSIRWWKRSWQRPDGTWDYISLPGKPGQRNFHLRYHGIAEYETKKAAKPTPAWRPATDRERFIASLVKSAKSRKKSKSNFFDGVEAIDARWIVEQCERQNWCCALTGIPFRIDTDNHRLRLYAPSLDRIDCGGNYTKENVRIVLLGVNLALNDFGLDFFDEIARARVGCLG